MTVVKKKDFRSFLNTGLEKTNVVLVYGPNVQAVNDTFQEAFNTACPDPDDPFLTASVSEESLKDVAGLLLDEALSLSLTGERKVITCLDPGPHFRKQIELLLSDISGPTNLIIARAGDLKASSALRKICEKSPNATVIPCYDDTPNELANLVRQNLDEHEKTMATENVRMLVGLCGSDRGLVLAELEKLVSYVGDKPQIEFNDIEALCTDNTGATMDKTIDAMLLGNTGTCIHLLQEMISNGIPASLFLDSVSNYLIRLQNWRLDTKNGTSAEQIVKTTRPPVFFKRQQIVVRQLGLWTSAKVSRAQKIVHSATKMMRQKPDISGEIAERMILNLAGLAKSR